MKTSDIEFGVKTFDQLTVHELYALLRLRQAVFSVEQDCPYLDLDDRDQEAIHLMGMDHQGIVHAYARILAQGVAYEGYASIGRVVTSAAWRGTGLGYRLMDLGIHCCRRQYPEALIKISAQVYAQGFYQKLGFRSVGDAYLEDDIPHIAMVWSDPNDMR